MHLVISKPHPLWLLLLLPLSTCASELPVLQGPLPEGVTITKDDKNLFIRSTQQNNVLTWTSFNVSEDAIVSFHLENYLNLVTGGTPSVINGNVFCSGNLYIVNPAGITQGLGSTLQARRLGLSTARLDDETISDFTTRGILSLPSGSGLGRINLLGEINTNNLIIDGSQVVIRDLEKLKSFSGDLQNNKSSDKITLKSSSGRIDIGGKADLRLQEDYGFEGEEYVSHLGQTPISTSEEFKAITSQGSYFLTNDLSLGELSAPLLAGDSFKGSLDGALSHLSYSLQDQRSGNGLKLGLFEGLDDAEISNLFLQAAVALPNARSASVGGLAGEIVNSKLQNLALITAIKTTDDNLMLNAESLNGVLMEARES